MTDSDGLAVGGVCPCEAPASGPNNPVRVSVRSEAELPGSWDEHTRTDAACRYLTSGDEVVERSDRFES